MRGTLMSAFFGMALAGCLGAPAVSSGGGSGGTSSGSGGGEEHGSGGSGSGGTTATGTGGSTGSGGTGEASGTGGSIATGGSTGSGGTSTTGTGGASATGGAMGTGGTGDAGRSGTGGAATGGRMGSGGAIGTGGGGPAGSSGTTATFDKPLRLEDACGSIQSTSTCLHQGKTTDDALPFSAMQVVNMGGTPGTMYQVKIHIRGIVEPTTISGGTVGTPRQFVTGGSAKPDNGNSGDGAYNQWRLTTTVPNQTYYLNAYPNTGHNIYAIDYMETIMIGGGSSVKLDVHDANAHLITNTSGSAGGPVATPTGVPALANNNVGQFVQVDVVQ
jgi:hypothetical protein